MTPEEIAQGIIDQLWSEWPDILDKDGTKGRIAQSIRDAYERAAVVAYESNAYEAASIAADIRALKEPPHER